MNMGFLTAEFYGGGGINIHRDGLGIVIRLYSENYQRTQDLNGTESSVNRTRNQILTDLYMALCPMHENGRMYRAIASYGDDLGDYPVTIHSENDLNYLLQELTVHGVTYNRNHGVINWIRRELSRNA